MPRFTVRHTPGQVAAVAFAILSATCASPIKPGPIADLIIQAVTPSTGPATGGTDVTIRGTGFAAGTTVTIGGRPATDVTVRGSDTITAKTPASPTSGPVDISVTVNGRTGTLANAFRYEVASNTAPIIQSITAQGTRTRQPANFADYGETIRITAVVEDAQTPTALLKYEWSDRCGGTFSGGSGAQLNWTAPISLGLPQNCAIELIVSDGPRIAANTITVRLHNSALEVAALARQFLDDFANSTIPAETAVRNFSDSCPGKFDELKQVTDNRNLLVINSHTYGDAKVTVAFGATCGIGSKVKTGDACVLTPAEWHSTYKADGRIEVAKGTSIITGIYRDSRWWLCDSLYQGASTLGLHHLY